MDPRGSYVAALLKPLAGQRIAVCDSGREGALVKALSDLGASARPWEALTFRPPEDPAAFGDACDDPDPWDVILVTSRRAAEAMGPRRGRCVGARVAAVGERTAGALRDLGWDVTHTGDAGALGLIRGLLRSGALSSSERVLYPVSSLGGHDAVELLDQQQIACQRVEIYRVLPECPHPEVVLTDVGAGLDAIAFTSPSAVSAVEAVLGENFATVLHGLVVAAIGPTTAAAVDRRGAATNLVVADPVGLEGVVEALRHRLEPKEE